MKAYKAKLLKVEEIAKKTKFFVFDFGKDFTFKPGQFITALVAPKTFRSYSIASNTQKLPRVEIAIKLIDGGIGSSYFDNLKEGNEVDFFGPFGHFVLPDNNDDKIFIATGVGIAPMRSFWQELNAKKNQQKMYLFYGYRFEDEMIFVDEIIKVPNLSFETCCSQPQCDDFQGVCGRVTILLPAKTPEFFQDKDIFLCGSNPMIEEVTKILTEEKGVDKKRIFFEKFS